MRPWPQVPLGSIRPHLLRAYLKAWNIPYTAMHTDDDCGQIDAAFAKAQETSLPTAVLLVAETA